MSFIHEGKSSLKENEFGVQDTFNYGLLNVKTQLSASHPLENQEKNRDKLEEEALMSQLRIAQGLNAPFKLEMERKFAHKIGRLPCLRSSNLMVDVLKGTDETIEIEDVLNNQKEFAEYNVDPHALLSSK